MNMQCLGEVATVCLFAMKLREESYDKAEGRYGLSLMQASEDAVMATAVGHSPEVQKAMVGLTHLMLTSWNDTESWATSIVVTMIAKETSYAHRKSAQPNGSNIVLPTEGTESPSAAQSVPETDAPDVLATVSHADGSSDPDVHASMVDTGGGFAYLRNYSGRQ